MPPKNLWHLWEGQNTKHYCTWTLWDRKHWSFDHQGPTLIGWTSYSHGGKQNTKGTLLRGAGRWSAFMGRSARKVQGVLKDNLKACDIPIETWDRQALNRPEWPTACCIGIKRFERRRIEQLQETLIARHAAQNQPASNTDYVYPDCQCHCRSRIGLISHRRKHAILLNWCFWSATAESIPPPRWMLLRERRSVGKRA